MSVRQPECSHRSQLVTLLQWKQRQKKILSFYWVTHLISKMFYKERSFYFDFYCFHLLMAGETGLIRGQFRWQRYRTFTRTCHSEVFDKILKVIPMTRCDFNGGMKSCDMLRTELRHQEKTHTLIIFIPVQVSKALQEKNQTCSAGYLLLCLFG